MNGILRFCAAVVESNNLDIEVPPSAEHRRFAPVMGQDCEKELIKKTLNPLLKDCSVQYTGSILLKLNLPK